MKHLRRSRAPQPFFWWPAPPTSPSASTGGSKGKVETVAAGKSVTVDCTDGCGVTGPWGFSWMASGDDEIATDGKPLVTVIDDTAGKAGKDE